LQTLAIFLILIISSLFVTSPAFAQIEDSESIVLTPTDDTYIGFDSLDPEDIQGLKKLNFGDTGILKLWYAYNSPGFEENEILSYAYIKFDLSEISSDEITSAKLMMYANYVDLAFDSIDVGLHNSDTNWSESSLFGYNATQFDLEPVAIVAVDAADKWYEWDITDMVIDHAGTNLSLAIVFGDITDHFAEIVQFASKDSTNSEIRPVLVIDKSTNQEELSSGGDFGVGFAVGLVIGAGGVAGVVVFMKKNKKPKTRKSIKNLSFKQSN